MRCPTVVGRRAELAALRSAAAAARIGRGSAAALVGPPGIGKSRLAREAADTARTWELPVLVGRAVESGSGTAFRPLTEALLAGMRHVDEPDDPALRPFRSALGRLLPHWRTRSPGVDPPGDPVAGEAVLGEAVLRLLATLAGDRGLLLVLEDLHWADPETLGVLEYLADNVAQERVFVLVTARDDPGPVTALLRALATRHACTRLPLAPLAADEVDAMAAACLGSAPPDDLRATLHRRAGGTPLLVEELLAAGAEAAAVVPDTVAGLVGARLDALAPAARRCVEAAAVLGARFDWELLAAVLDSPAEEVLAGLRAATRAGLLVAGEGTVGFHHALGRDAVLAALLPPERARWARRGLRAVLAAHPELDGTWCDLAADLALRAGDTARAAAALLEAGWRNLDRGALTSAESVLRRAGELAGDDPALAAAADDALADVLAASGQTTEAVAVATRCVRRLPARGEAAVSARLRLAGIHATAGDWAAADAELAAARRAGAVDDPRVEAAAARVALGAGRLPDAAALAAGVLERAEDPAVTCEALLVLGRIARRDDLARAEELTERALRTAEDAGLPVPAARARHELAISDVQVSLRLDRLADARDRASAIGDLAAVAVLDLQRAAAHHARGEPGEALAAARASAAASRRYRLATLPKALLLGAAAHVLLGDDDRAEHDMAEALALAPRDTHLHGEVWGVRATRALAAADDRRALADLDRAVAAFAQQPNEVSGSPSVGLWMLLRAAADPTGTVPDPPDPQTARWNVGLAGFARAVALGRRGDRDGALAAFGAADTLLREPVDIAWYRLQARRVATGAALADGWGDPAGWAAQDVGRWEARGEHRCAAAVRGLWRRTGAVVPRGNAGVPPVLRERGVTAREADVLALVAEGRANRDIAQWLHLSPRTVEKHVEHLLAKSGCTGRPELVAWALRVLRDESGRTATGRGPAV
ncbi:ATP-binding protein [Pseudonocardia hydrocarbonoxydans]|uniref:ATP-binding protein n=1 Tax=Pseudonocardia hydrocarbonoxydans TaxID=76726 RepID=UPI0014772B02|nr:LuxR family transcriptional regulator [Pseudonocardia hydrocarbonoxydans]